MSRPIGTATTIAMRLMSAVPAKIGMAPNEPSEATLSHVMQFGLHLRPNRNSNGDTKETKGFEQERQNNADRC